MSEKKIHEVTSMGNFISFVCNFMKVNVVVDIGAGEGYISHILFNQYHLNVVAIEGNNSFIQYGERRINMVNKLLENRDKKKIEKKRVEDLPVKEKNRSQVFFLPYVFDRNNIPEFQKQLSPLLSKLNQDIYFSEIHSLKLETIASTLINDPTRESSTRERIMNENTTASNNTERNFVIIGLHTCGNLAWTLMDLFLNSEAVAMIGIGCCYHSLVDENDRDGIRNDEKRWFARSKAILSIYPNITSQALKLATQATFQYAQSSPDSPLVSGSTLSYRAVIEIALFRHFQDKNYKMKTVKKNHYKDFSDFLDQVQDKLHYKDTKMKKWILAKESLSSLREEFLAAYRECEPHFGLLVIWIALQMVLSPVIEALLLLDRLLYLLEYSSKGSIEAAILPLFDASISPRNLAIVATKRSIQREYSKDLREPSSSTRNKEDQCDGGLYNTNLFSRLKEEFSVP